MQKIKENVMGRCVLFIQNMKPNIFDNESKNIFNNIVSYLGLLAMGTTKKRCIRLSLKVGHIKE